MYATTHQPTAPTKEVPECCDTHAVYNVLATWSPSGCANGTQHKPCSCRDCCVNHLCVVTCQTALHTVLPWHATGLAPTPLLPLPGSTVKACRDRCLQQHPGPMAISRMSGQVTCYWCSTGVTTPPCGQKHTHPTPQDSQKHPPIHTHSASPARGPRGQWRESAPPNTHCAHACWWPAHRTPACSDALAQGQAVVHKQEKPPTEHHIRAGVPLLPRFEDTGANLQGLESHTAHKGCTPLLRANSWMVAPQIN